MSPEPVQIVLPAYNQVASTFSPHFAAMASSQQPRNQLMAELWPFHVRCGCDVLVLSFPNVSFGAQQFKLTIEASEEASESRNPEGHGPQPAASVRLIDQTARMTFGKLCTL